MKFNFMRVAILEPRIHLGDVQHNIHALGMLINELPQNVDLICLSPLAATGATIEDLCHDPLLRVQQFNFIEVLSEACRMKQCKALITIFDFADQTQLKYLEDTPFANTDAILESLVLLDEEGSRVPLHLQALEYNYKQECFINDHLHIIWDRRPVFADDPYMQNMRYRMLSKNSHVIYIGNNKYESTSHNVYTGEIAVYELGEKLALNHNSYEHGDISMVDLDIAKVKGFRSGKDVFPNTNVAFREKFSNSKMDFEIRDLYRQMPRFLFLPVELREKIGNRSVQSLLEDAYTKKDEFYDYYEKVLDLAAWGLARRMDFLGKDTKVVLGLSGGLDSTCSLLIAKRALEMLKRPYTDLHAVSMPGLGTSDLTKSNSFLLADAVGCSFREIPIKEAVLKHLEAIGHDIDKRDVTYENAQARERTQILMDLANSIGGFVLGTGDLSEISIGFATYNGDHMSMYNVNASIPKSLMRLLVMHEAQRQPQLAQILKAIVETPVSPELLPPSAEGEIQQKTENIVGSYELIDFVIYNIQKYRMFSGDILYRAYQTFNDDYSLEEIHKSLMEFYRRFFNSQYKRNCAADGAAVLSVHLAPSEEGLQMPSDIYKDMFMKKLEDLKDFF